MMELKWVTNELNDRFKAFEKQRRQGVFSSQAQYDQWRNRFITGNPKPSAEYSVAELRAMGLIGLYERV